MLNRNGWKKTTLGQMADYINGYAFKPSDWQKSGLPIIRIEQMNNPNADCDYYPGTISQKYLLSDGDLLFSWSGTLTTLIWDRGPAILNQHIFKVVPKGCDRDYLYHLLTWLIEPLSNLSHGSTMKHVKRPDLMTFPVDLPMPQEQVLISQVLNVVNHLIKKTEQLIAKLKQIKAGLLHDLLTRGLDENGELRDPVVHPEQFCNSPVGRIPKVWGIGSLSGLAIGGFLNGIFKKPEDVGSGYLLLNVLDLYQDFGIDLSLVQRLKTSERNRQKYSVEEGDCFFTRSSLNMAGIAHCNVVRYVPEPTIFECHLMRIRPNKSLVVPEFLALWCRSTWARRFFMARARQVTMTTISQEDIGPLPVPLPPISEQVLIVRINDEYEKCIKREKRYLEKLIKIKSGLMHDLLTGKVRVPLDKEGE
ncbi:MAG: restriction endonuclease subunit S [Peptococcaceae bacterium]|nr:restriction endonuclease subunit S [Peptococcaceae bacterium]